MCQLVRSPMRRVLRWTAIALLVAATITILLYQFSRVPGTPEDHTLGLSLLPAVVVFALLGLLRFIYSRSVDRTYARDPSLQRESIADFDAQAIQFDDSSGATAKATWSHFNRYAEGQRVFVIGTPSRVFNIVPKSGMCADQQNALRSILAQHIPAK